jgi:hypothetical protein
MFKKQKILFLLLFVMLGMAMIYPKIVVQKPKCNDLWIFGESYEIRWIKTPEQGSAIKITLVHPTDNSQPPIKLIKAPNVGGNIGSFTWNIPHNYNVKPGAYRIKVKKFKENLVGYSCKFTLLPKKPKFNFKVQNIRVFKPDKKSIWKVGNECTIEWENLWSKNFPTSIQLYKTDMKQLVLTIVSKQKFPSSGPTSKHQWPIPKDKNLSGNYKIKVSNVGARGFSDMFQIQPATSIIKVNLTVQTANMASCHKHITTNKFTMAVPEFPDPGPGKMRVGFLNAYVASDERTHWIYRSYLKFDINQLKGKKGLVLKAILKYKFTNHLSQPAALAPNRLFVLDEAWNGTRDHLFNIAMTSHNSLTNITSIVSAWVLGQSPNYGLLMVGPPETMLPNKDFCIGISDQVVVELEYQEQLIN